MTRARTGWSTTSRTRAVFGGSWSSVLIRFLPSAMRCREGQRTTWLGNVAAAQWRLAGMTVRNDRAAHGCHARLQAPGSRSSRPPASVGWTEGPRYGTPDAAADGWAGTPVAGHGREQRAAGAPGDRGDLEWRRSRAGRSGVRPRLRQPRRAYPDLVRGPEAIKSASRCTAWPSPSSGLLWSICLPRGRPLRCAGPPTGLRVATAGVTPDRDPDTLRGMTFARMIAGQIMESWTYWETAKGRRRTRSVTCFLAAPRATAEATA